jgi:hypothetical protein
MKANTNHTNCPTCEDILAELMEAWVTEVQDDTKSVLSEMSTFCEGHGATLSQYGVMGEEVTL